MNPRNRMSLLATLAVVLVLTGLGRAADKAEQSWPSPVKDFKPPQAGEHPRLFFRKTDLPDLKKRAETPEGKVIIARLKELLGGGDAMPTEFNPNKGKQPDGANGFEPKAATGQTYTLFHAAGFGMLYQLTGEKKYADLGKQCAEKALDGQRDRDNRYSFKDPTGALRAGSSLASMAMAYDLCYDGWDEDFRKKVALAMQDYNEGQYMSLAELTQGKRHSPPVNHWGPQVGGAALALLAIQGDHGTDEKKIKGLLADSEKAMLRQLTEGFGDHGWFAEGDGPGTIASDTAFVPALQAWRVAGGKDFISPRSNAQWLTLKWMMLTVPGADGKPQFPTRGTYGHNVWSRVGMSGSGTFSQGFGAVADEFKPALLWTYNHCVSPKECDYDTVSVYPHRAVLAFVNWPVGVKEKNPGDVLPRAVEDKARAFYMFRNRWQDENDVIVTSLLKTSKGNYDVKAGPIIVWGLGQKTQFPVPLSGEVKAFEATKTGGVVSTETQSFAVDFSGASGADALLVMSYKGTPPKNIPTVTTVTINDRLFTVMTLQKGAAPEVKVDGDKVKVGGQTIGFDGKALVLTK